MATVVALSLQAVSLVNSILFISRYLGFECQSYLFTTTSVAVVSLAAVFVVSRNAPPHWTKQKGL